MNSKLRTLLIGCGEHSQENLIPSLAAIRNANVTAICDHNKHCLDAASQWFPQAKRYYEANFNDQTLKEFDAIIIAATPQLHSYVADKALKLNIPIFLEKPPAIDTKTLRDIAKIAEQNSVVTCVGHNLRHSTAALELQNCIQKDEFGLPVSMEMRYMASKPKGNRWGLEDPIRSFMLSHAIHAIDLMIFHMGTIKETVAARAWPDHDSGVAIAAQFQFSTGAIGNLLASSYAPHFTVSTSILSDKGRIASMNGLHEVSVSGLPCMEKRWNANWSPRTLESGYTFSGYKTELDNFFHGILNDNQAEARPSLTDEVHTYEVMDNIVSSIKGRKIL